MRGTILAEFGWLLYFAILLATAVYAFNLTLVPHHFNDKVADVLAAMLAALAFIATRAYARRRAA